MSVRRACLRAANFDGRAARRRPFGLPLATGVRQRQLFYTTVAEQSLDSSHNGASPPRKAQSGNKNPEKKRQHPFLRGLSDPLKLADKVEQLINQEKADEALGLVRDASKFMDATVSWNYIIDHEFKTGHINEALKRYQDMKKRGQSPSAHTITILLRGLAKLRHNSPNTASKALHIYNSLSNENSPVKVNLVHTNAAIKVCASSGDLDAMWELIGRMPENGPGAPDAVTYTTILNSLATKLQSITPPYQTREELEKRHELEDDKVPQNNNAAMNDIVDKGRKIWWDVIAKWKTADIVMDESLVCAMGRLLQHSHRPQDWDAVMCLLHQTMQIPIYLPRLGTKERELLPFTRKVRDAIKETEKSDNQTPGEEFNPVVFSDVMKKVFEDAGESLYARPGNKTLSLILNTLKQVSIKKPAMDYWELLTSADGPYKLKPDHDNVHAMLRILRIMRSSKEAVELITQFLPTIGLSPLPKDFIIAMAACQRDLQNPNVFKTATSLINLLDPAGPANYPVKVLYMYLDLARLTGNPKNMKMALSKLHPHAVRLKNAMVYGKTEKVGAGKVRLKDSRQTSRRETVDFWRFIWSTVDSLMNTDGMVEQSERHWLKGYKSEISQWVGRYEWQIPERHSSDKDGKGELAKGGKGEKGELGDMDADR